MCYFLGLLELFADQPYLHLNLFIALWRLSAVYALVTSSSFIGDWRVKKGSLNNFYLWNDHIIKDLTSRRHRDHYDI